MRITTFEVRGPTWPVFLMRGVTVGMLVAASRVASAEPEATPRSPSPFHVAARVGVHTIATYATDDSPSGSGPWVDLEAGYRVTDRFIASAFVDYMYFRDPHIADPFTTTVYSAREDIIEIGARGTLRVGHGWQLGLGLGTVRERIAVHGSQPFWHGLKLVELVGGYTFASHRGCSFQVLGVVSYAFEDLGSDELRSARLGLGLQF